MNKNKRYNEKRRPHQLIAKGIFKFQRWQFANITMVAYATVKNIYAYM